MIVHTAAILLIVCSTAFGLLGSMKHVTVKGRATCGGMTAKNVKVELWEDDTLGFDDKLNTTTTNTIGGFIVYGQAREIRNIEPYLLFHHSCDNGVQSSTCTFVDRYDVPKSSVGKTHDFGAIKLETATKKRKKNCKKY